LLAGVYAGIVIDGLWRREFLGRIDCFPPEQEPRGSLAVVGFVGIVFALVVSCFYQLMLKGWFNASDFINLKEAMCIRSNPLYTFIEPIRLADYRPLQVLYCYINDRMWGHSFFGWTFSHLAVHFMNCLILFMIGSRVLASKFKAGIATFLFAIHPISTATIAAMITGETNIATLFSLFSVLTYMMYMERDRAVYMWIATVFFMIAVLIKEAAATLPLVIFSLHFMYDIGRGFPLRRAFKKALLRSLPFLVALLAIFIWRLYLLGGNMGNDFINPSPAPGEGFTMSGMIFRFFYNVPASFCVSDGGGMMRLGSHPLRVFCLLTTVWCLLLILSFRNHVARLHCQTALCLAIMVIMVLPVSALLYDRIIQPRWFFPALPYFCLLVASLYDGEQKLRRRGAVLLLLATVAFFFMITSRQIVARTVAYHEEQNARAVQEGVVQVVEKDFTSAPPGSVFLILGLNRSERQEMSNWAIKTLSGEPRFWEYLFLYNADESASEWFIGDTYPECLLDQIWYHLYPPGRKKQEYPDMDLYRDGRSIGYLTWFPISKNDVSMEGRMEWIDAPSARTGGRWVEITYPAPTLDEALRKAWNIYFLEYSRGKGFKTLSRGEVIARLKK
jgi:hypothetical protein